MSAPVSFAFFGSSLVSAYWNGACTYYRGLIRGLHDRGHRVTFYEPHAYERQEHRDIADPDWARVVVYEPSSEDAVRRVVRSAVGADVVVKASGVGVYDDVLEDEVVHLPGSGLKVFWDVDAPATLSAMESGELADLRDLIPRYDLVLTYGGGVPVRERYGALGARECHAIYNALEPLSHHPVDARQDLSCDLLFVGNRLPDREQRVREFFFGAAEVAPSCSFLLGGSGWDGDELPNVRALGHVSPQDHNVLNSSARAVLNVTRESMASNGFSPPTRLFEAVGAGACLITDEWQGIDLFLEPGEQILVARDGLEVATLLESLEPARARRIGKAGLERLLREHTYALRAAEVERLIATCRAERTT